MSARPKLAVILGAGASYDVCRAEEAVEDDKWRPPIVCKMFESGAFDEVLGRGGRYEDASSIMSSVRTADAPFEETLRRFLDNPESNIQRQIAAVPIALHEFFYLVRVRHTRQPIGYSALVNAIRERDIHAAFITVNYDTFLDDALKRYADDPLDTVKSYTSSRDWLLIKLHGSVGWGYRWCEARGISHPSDVPRDVPPPERDPGSIAVGMSSNLHGGGSIFYPALALPVKGKYEFVCPPSHVEALERFLGDCENFLFIGFSANDQHLLELLAQTISAPTMIAVVAENKGAVTDILDRLKQRVPQFNRAPRPPLSQILPETRRFSSGFGAFVHGECGHLLDSVAN